MEAAIEDPDDAQWWQRAFAAKYHGEGSFGKGDWDMLLGHCQVSDFCIGGGKGDVDLGDGDADLRGLGGCGYSDGLFCGGVD